MADVFLDALIDTLKVLPFLLIMNFVIEIVEYKTDGLRADKILKGGFAPLIGAAVGVVPQCGFSVVATELYTKKRIALGTLLAVYIATSDEALPIMLSSYSGVTKLLPVLIIKVCFALLVGYGAFAVEKILNKRRASSAPTVEHDEHNRAECEENEHYDRKHTEAEESGEEGEHVHVHIHGCHKHSLSAESDVDPASMTKKQKAARIWNLYFKHPLFHTATVVFYILIVNILFGITVYYVGEERLAQFIGSTGLLQPVLAATVGLIPNCAASVVITELYVVGGLNLGGAVSGLCVSAGIGYAVLAKQNKPIGNTVLVIALTYVLSVVLGMCVNLIAPLF